MAKRTPARLIAKALIVVAAATGVAVLTWTLLTRWHPDDAAFPIQGVDVSARNGPVDWHVVHARGAAFGYTLATIGAEGRDARFEANWAAIPAAAMRRGAIHRYSLCDDATEQAANFVRTVPRTADALPSAVEIDFEPGCANRPPRDEVVRDVATFLTLAEHHMGKPMLMIVSHRFAEQYRLGEALPRPIWAQRFFFEPDYTARPWRMWRASTIRRIDGAEGAVNWDVVAR